VTTLFQKRGRRYFPVAEYDPLITESFEYGHHLVSVSPGLKMTTYQVEPEQAPILAALREHRETLAKAIKEASAKRPSSGRLTQRELAAFQVWKEMIGQDAFTILVPSAFDILDALEKLLIEACQK
jgi:hypothetical protein